MPKEDVREIPTYLAIGANGRVVQPELMPPAPPPIRQPTIEREGFVNGLFDELDHAHRYYLQLVEQIAQYRGRLEVAERNLRLTRDYLISLLSETDEDVPKDWERVLNRVRFVGARLGDACLDILRRRRALTTEALRDELNSGQFRFRTGSPLREIHAALLRQPRVKREGDQWVYVSKKTRKDSAVEARKSAGKGGAATASKRSQVP